MNWLENLGNSLFSHPNYPFKNHVKNIADSFDDREHKESAYFHDIAKLSDDFQSYINGNFKRKTTHAFESAFVYFCQQGEFRSWEESAIFYSILKHHINLPNIFEDIIANHFDDFDELLFKKTGLFEKLESIQKNLQNEYRYKEEDLESFCDFFNVFKKQIEKIETINIYFLFKLRFSKLIFADKYEAIFHASYKPEKSFEPQKYIDNLEDLIVKKNEENKIDLNNNRNKARIEILENYQSNCSKKIFIIEAPTGIGKTLAALRLALEIAKNENKQTIITALPFTSIIEQTHSEYRQIFEDNILLKYHHLTDNKQYISDTEQNQNLQKNDYIASTWAFDDVIVTTFNQLFYTIFSNKNRDLTKFWRLENSVIILDEIQSIPRVLLKDVAETLAFLSEAYNIHFILMSATIPAIKEFLGKESYAELLSEEYYKGNERYTIVPNFNMSFEGLKKEIRDKSKTQSVLCVVNTKKLDSKIF
ncbi:MAG: DEAD/DEAH box helicase, partial [Wolinella succinogenes]|uniref:DEAD/DEAH box helicase n=1 Tax=Wolinella succinogenes TaxID=844 RepID=UPI0016B8392B|nr:DEAD/DEAH box helicase [Wolinella succinogenes]